MNPSKSETRSQPCTPPSQLLSRISIGAGEVLQAVKLLQLWAAVLLRAWIQNRMRWFLELGDSSWKSYTLWWQSMLDGAQLYW